MYGGAYYGQVYWGQLYPTIVEVDTGVVKQYDDSFISGSTKIFESKNIIVKEANLNKGKKFRDTELNAMPLYTTSMGGNPYTDRLDGGISTNANLYKSEDTLTFNYTLIGSSANVIMYHNLGYRPLIIGGYKMYNSTVLVGLAYPEPLYGYVPEIKAPIWGAAAEHSVLINLIDTQKFRISINTGATFAMFSFKLFLLREETVNT